MPGRIPVESTQVANGIFIVGYYTMEEMLREGGC